MRNTRKESQAVTAVRLVKGLKELPAREWEEVSKREARAVEPTVQHNGSHDPFMHFRSSAV